MTEIRWGEPDVDWSAADDWWRGAVIYQIYPRSYQDSNADGIGDLVGIQQRLPYLASLGIDAIWISPFFESPMRDFGYDVSNYRAIDPMFGSMDDFDTLIDAAHELNLKVMIDLVLSHTSDQHPWFSASRASTDNDYSDWYVWADAKADGTPPNNWLSIFGGPAWQWDTRRQQYYLHNFLASQPDLNFHCAAVQDALLDLTRFWLERKVDGFRLDTINFYVHDLALRDNPALPETARNASIAPRVNPYNHQLHLYSKNQIENLAFLERFRALLDEFEARACLGEIGDAQHGLEILGDYTKGERRAHMCYAFEMLQVEPVKPEQIADVFARLARVAADGWACWAFSNHDVMRHASRWQLSDEAIRCYVNLMMCLRGSACLYQGEELGLREAELAFEDLQDPYGIEFWPEFKGRDGCRTPMVWDANLEQGGFSPVQPWLPVSAGQLGRAVETQQVDSDSLLHHYRHAIALRHRHRLLADGDIEIIEAQDSLLRFFRRNRHATAYCVFNLGATVVEAAVPEGLWRNLGATVGGLPVTNENRVKLAAWQCLIWGEGD